MAPRKIPVKYSCEEIYDRMSNGLCIFCEDLDTPGHHDLKHKGMRILVTESDDEEEPIVTEDGDEPIVEESLVESETFITETATKPDSFSESLEFLTSDLQIVDGAGQEEAQNKSDAEENMSFSFGNKIEHMVSKQSQKADRIWEPGGFLINPGRQMLQTQAILHGQEICEEISQLYQSQKDQRVWEPGGLLTEAAQWYWPEKWQSLRFSAATSEKMAERVWEPGGLSAKEIQRHWTEKLCSQDDMLQLTPKLHLQILWLMLQSFQSDDTASIKQILFLVVERATAWCLCLKMKIFLSPRLLHEKGKSAFVGPETVQTKLFILEQESVYDGGIRLNLIDLVFVGGKIGIKSELFVTFLRMQIWGFWKRGSQQQYLDSILKTSQMAGHVYHRWKVKAWKWLTVSGLMMLCLGQMELRYCTGTWSIKGYPNNASGFDIMVSGPKDFDGAYVWNVSIKQSRNYSFIEFLMQWKWYPPEFSLIKKSLEGLNKSKKCHMLLIYKSHNLLLPEAGFWTDYNDLEQFSIELQSSPKIFYVDGVPEFYTGSKLQIGKETQGKVLLVLTEASMLGIANKANVVVKENWFHSHPTIEEVFHLLMPPEEIHRHFGLFCGLLVKLRLVRRMITEAETIRNKTTSLTSISYHLVLHMWKENPPDQDQLHCESTKFISSLRTRMFSTREYCYRIITLVLSLSVMPLV